MSQERTEALVLRGAPFGETSRIVTFLTPDRGRIACLAKGVHRARNPLAAALDTFNLVEAVYYWKDGRGVQNLGEAALLEGFRGVKGDLEKSAWAAFPLELAYKLAHENEPNPELYAALRDGLRALEGWRGGAAVFVCQWTIALLTAGGFAPELSVCVHCGGELPGAPGFDYDAGLTCGKCRSDRRLSPAAARVLRGESDETAAAEAFQALRGYAARQVDADFRSARVIEAMFGA